MHSFYGSMTAAMTLHLHVERVCATAFPSARGASSTPVAAAVPGCLYHLTFYLYRSFLAFMPCSEAAALLHTWCSALSLQRSCWLAALSCKHRGATGLVPYLWVQRRCLLSALSLWL